MAIAVVNSKQTASTASATLSGLTAATKGNLLVVFVAQLASTVVPTASGFTFNETKCTYNTTASLWVGTKEAAGGETEIVVTPGSGGTVEGLSYFEVSGASTTVDAIVHTDNSGAVKTVTTPSVTTTNAGDVLLAAVGFPAAASETVEAWTGTKVLTNIGTTSTRCIGASLVLTETLAGATFTAKWTKELKVGILLVALKPAAGTTFTGAMAVRTGASVAARGAMLTKGTMAPVTGAQANATGAMLTKGTMAPVTGAQANATGAMLTRSPMGVVAGARVAAAGLLKVAGPAPSVTGATFSARGVAVTGGPMGVMSGARVTATGRLTAVGRMTARTGAVTVSGGRLIAVSPMALRTGAVVTIKTVELHGGSLGTITTTITGLYTTTLTIV